MHFFCLLMTVKFGITKGENDYLGESKKKTRPDIRLLKSRAGGEGQWWRRSLACFNVFVITQTFVRQAATVACSLWLFIILNVFIITQTYVCQAAIATHFNDTPLSFLSFSFSQTWFFQAATATCSQWLSIIFTAFVIAQTHSLAVTFNYLFCLCLYSNTC